MTYKEFKQIIDLQIAHNKRLRELYRLKVDLDDLFDQQAQAVQLLWKSVLTEYGYDWLSWYLYEKDGISGKPRPHLSAWDDQTEICKDLKGLWQYLTEQKYFKV